jgi:hypothetical protein
LVISLCPRDKRTMSVVAAYRLTPTSLKNFWLQISAGKFLVSISWAQDGILDIFIIQRDKLSNRSITHPCWCNWRIFWM